MVFGKWEFPGGELEKDEDEYRAIEREIKEEFELHNHSEYKFVSKFDLLSYDLCLADIRLAEYVMEVM